MSTHRISMIIPWHHGALYLEVPSDGFTEALLNLKKVAREAVKEEAKIYITENSRIQFELSLSFSDEEEETARIYSELEGQGWSHISE